MGVGPFNTNFSLAFCLMAWFCAFSPRAGYSCRTGGIELISQSESIFTPKISMAGRVRGSHLICKIIGFNLAVEHRRYAEIPWDTTSKGSSSPSPSLPDATQKFSIAVFVNAQQARDQSRPTRPTFLSALSTFALVFVILAFGILDGKNGRYARYTLYTPRLLIQVKQEKIKCATLQLAFPFLPSFPLSPSSSSFIAVQLRSTALHMHEACCSMFIRQFSMWWSLMGQYGVLSTVHLLRIWTVRCPRSSGQSVGRRDRTSSLLQVWTSAAVVNAST